MKNGNSLITVPIILVFSIIVLVTVGTLLLNIIQPYILYEKMLSTSLRYMFVIEEYGYLSNYDKSLLINDLVEQGFERNRIQINCTDTLQDYGDTVFLEIGYIYYLDEYEVIPNSLIVNTKIKEIPMRVIKYGVSKR